LIVLQFLVVLLLTQVRIRIVTQPSVEQFFTFLQIQYSLISGPPSNKMLLLKEQFIVKVAMQLSLVQFLETTLHMMAL
jgi:hypothetical protein